MKAVLAACALACTFALICADASADHEAVRADSHGPIGVMGDHTHEKSEWMFSYRYMHMDMQGNRDGRSDLSADEIVTSVPNRFAGMPGMPPTLRVVPTSMTMQMHMFGVMYAPSDRITLMAMLNYIDKEMDHVTYMGGAGTNVLGEFTTRTSGLGDTRISALVSLYGSRQHSVHATVGVSLPTGEQDEEDRILTPMNMRPEVRLPYPMQLGSGTYDVIGGLTYTGGYAEWGWGAQWQSLWRTGDNDEGYTLGDEHQFSGWLSYLVDPALSVSARLAYFDRANLSGIDPAIRAPVQTADPDRQGARRLDLGLGVNFVLPGDRHRLALEWSTPLRQTLSGPQLETDWQLTLGWQFAP